MSTRCKHATLCVCAQACKPRPRYQRGLMGRGHGAAQTTLLLCLGLLPEQLPFGSRVGTAFGWIIVLAGKASAMLGNLDQWLESRAVLHPRPG